MATIPNQEPTRVWSGATVTWRRSFPDYPAPTWTLAYKIVGMGNGVGPITAAADGSNHLVTEAKADTFEWIPGTYRLVGYVDDGTSRYVVYEGQLEVVYDPSTVAEGYEHRSFWRRVRDNLRDIIEGKSQQANSSYQIAGRSVNKMTWQELLDVYNRAASMVKDEEAADRARRGESSGNQIGIAFTPTR